ncbi:BspA family leucine-rich repeat surface protein [Companilactobacillus halodurans]|uniref:BspA family leucine-rich repeat surface protein n=1 Tax=Companilactobacillus halodurans TaxID=2584183 RepID=A0A5P0ZUC9_9LACO|nr:BspA family leucine-rich repeat surface protein [Companilactobacillus halodurans]MQS96637.1 BspA family leucine-rich repeat surface protein [Companilactobacillus halodurans]
MKKIENKHGPRQTHPRFVFILTNFIFGLNIILFKPVLIKADSDVDAQQIIDQNSSLTLQNQSMVKTVLQPLAINSTSGTFGTCDWDIDSDGLLTIHAGQLGVGQGNWIESNALIKKIYVEPGVVASTDSNNLFAMLTNVQTIDLTNLDTSNVKSFYRMFYFERKLMSTSPNTSSLTQIIGLDKLDTNSAINMSGMFMNAYQLSSIDVSNFDTKNVIDFSSMFSMANGSKTENALTEIKGLNNLNTSKAENLNSMFNNDSNLTQLDVSNFDTTNVNDIGSMFNNDSSLTNLDVSNFKTGKVTDFSSMFSGCSALGKLDLSKFDTSNATNMNSFFNNCHANIQGLIDFDTSKVENMESMFSGTWIENTDDIKNWNTSKVTNMNGMFASCSKLTNVDLSQMNKSNVINISSLFYNDSAITEIKGLDTWDTSKVENMAQTFSGTRLTQLAIENWNTSNVTDMSYLFYNCTKLTSLDLSAWDTSKVTTMQYMFAVSLAANENVLKGLDKFDTSNVTDMSGMFSNTGFKTLDLSSFNTSKVTNMGNMFSNNKNYLTKIIGNFDTSNVKEMQSLFNNTDVQDFSDFNIAEWDVENVTNLSTAFGNSDYEKLDILKNWNPKKCTNFKSMFEKDDNLQALDLSNWTMSANSDRSRMLNSDKNLWKISLGPNSLLNSTMNLPIPVVGTKFQDQDTNYSAISTKWQEVAPDSGGTDHDPVGKLFSTDEIIAMYSNSGQDVLTFVWQQEEYRELSMTVPDIAYGTVNAPQGVLNRQNKTNLSITKYSYPTTNVKYDLTVSMDHPLTTADGQNQLPGTLIYRDANNRVISLDESPAEIYDGMIGNETKTFNWENDQGILLNITGKNIVSGTYSTTLTWTLENSL